MMKRTSLIIFLMSAVLTATLGVPALAQEEAEAERDSDHYISSAPTVTTNRGIGLAITVPLPTLPTPTTSATLFIDTFFQAPISESLLYRADVRFFFHFLNGFRFDLTSVRNSFLVTFTGPPVVFAVGGGFGIFPIQGVPVGTSDGFMLSMHVKTNLEVRVGILGLFLDFTYEPMPQPFADIDAAGSLITSAVQFSIGTIFHF